MNPLIVLLLLASSAVAQTCYTLPNGRRVCTPNPVLFRVTHPLASVDHYATAAVRGEATQSYGSTGGGSHGGFARYSNERDVTAEVAELRVQAAKVATLEARCEKLESSLNAARTELGAVKAAAIERAANEAFGERTHATKRQPLTKMPAGDVLLRMPPGDVLLAMPHGDVLLAAL